MIGFDCGTYNLVSCRRDEKRNPVYKREVNAFIEMPLENRFVFNMMKKAGVPLIERPEAGLAYALGEAAVNMAYTMDRIELKRPMKDGCLNPQEKFAQQVMSIMMHGMLDDLNQDNQILCYSVPANAVNEETDAEYHNVILKAVFDAFQDSTGKRVQAHPVNEALALVYAELKEKQWTGIGISFGAGMVNLCYAIYGNPVFQFSIVNSGDWIDKMAAKASGESIAYINKEKTKLDLGANQDSLVLRAIKAQYEIMIQRTVAEIKKGVEQAGSKAHAPKPIDIIIAGGTSSPAGFDKMFAEHFHKANIPLEVNSIVRPKDPLYSVARGCLLAAENMF